MFLIADSGSTCTNWKVVNNKDIVASFNTKGFNPYFTKPKEIASELTDNFPENINKKEIEKVFFYGAGCSSESLKQIINNGISAFISNSEITIEHDLLGAARALFQNDKGIAIILGTGSNTCHYDGKEITKNVSSLGFILGDEGGGDYMGKLFIQSILNKELPEKLINDFYLYHNLDSGKILSAVYKEEYPNRFLASFTKYLKEKSDIPEVKEIIYKTFTDLFEKHICKYETHLTDRIRATGSIAYYFEEELNSIADSFNCNIDLIVKEPIDLLVQHHMNNDLI